MSTRIHVGTCWHVSISFLPQRLNAFTEKQVSPGLRIFDDSALLPRNQASENFPHFSQKISAGSNVLACFVNEKEDVVFAGLPANQLNDSPSTVAKIRSLLEAQASEAPWSRKFLEL
jgi:hypothetical protein